MTERQHRSSVVRTADMIATLNGKFVLVERLKFPFGLALPGGHIEAGERPRDAAIREFAEETGLRVSHTHFVTRRTGKRRDPRYQMTTTSVYAGIAEGATTNERGHTKVVLMDKQVLLRTPRERFAFDHHAILMHYLGTTTKGA